MIIGALAEDMPGILAPNPRPDSYLGGISWFTIYHAIHTLALPRVKIVG